MGNNRPLKKQHNFRLDQETIRQLRQLAGRWGTNATAALIRCVNRTHQQEGIPHEEPKPEPESPAPPQ